MISRSRFRITAAIAFVAVALLLRASEGAVPKTTAASGAAESSLLIDLSVDGFSDPALPFGVLVNYRNYSKTELHDVTITIDVPGVDEYRDLPDNCSFDGSRAICAIGDLAPGPFQIMWIHPVAPNDPDGGDLVIQARIHASEDPESSSSRLSRTYRSYYVTTTIDNGDGSLREAIKSANAACDDVPCKIAFRIPRPTDTGWHTIRPLSALPALTASYLSLDGTTQTRFFGDCNPSGPEVEISGSAIQGSEDGIRLEAHCYAEVRGLAINSFRGSGVLVHWSPPGCRFRYQPIIIHECHLGTEPAGMQAMPNVRGVVVDTGPFAPPVTIEGNLVSGNLRSGLFFLSGYSGLASRNRIGLNRTLTGPLSNGASGIYVAPGASGTDIVDNFIGFNHDSGVSIAASADLVEVRGNSIQANWQLGIDYGLDGVSSSFVTGTGEYLPVPEITLAKTDPESRSTIIEGTLDPNTGGGGVRSNFVNLYANDAPSPSGYGEGQYFLGTVRVESGRFTFRHESDLSSKWVAATATTWHYIGFLGARGVEPDGTSQGELTTTSEFSRAVRVVR